MHTPRPPPGQAVVDGKSHWISSRSVRLNRQQADGAKAVFDLDLGDAGTHVLEPGDGALNHTAGRQADDADATVTLSRDTLNRIFLREVTLADAVRAGDVELDGDRAKLDELRANLDRFEFWFNVVTP